MASPAADSASPRNAKQRPGMDPIANLKLVGEAKDISEVSENPQKLGRVIRQLDLPLRAFWKATTFLRRSRYSGQSYAHSLPRLPRCCLAFLRSSTFR